MKSNSIAKRFVLVFILLAILSLNFAFTYAESQNYICAVYFTGIGCPHCAKTDPVVLGKLPQQYKNLIIVEYEIYQLRENAPLLATYNSAYNSGLGVPLIIFGRNQSIIGDSPILNNIEGVLNSLKSNPCPLVDGSSTEFARVDITALPGKPKIWANDRILIKVGEAGNNEILKKLLVTSDIPSALEGVEYKIVEPEPAPLSGSEVKFEHAVQIAGWVLQWNGEGLSAQGTQGNSQTTKTNENQTNGTAQEAPELTLAKILGLAAVDAINPCALAVLTLMLIAILTYNPKNKRNVLLAGLAFTASVFIIYLFYGLVIIRFFQLVQLLTSIRLLLYKILGIAAILLGLLNIKDFIRYKPGGLLTEMPLSWRPKVKKLISGITSPAGAFILGAFVTIFLLPCTIGPYVIAGGILSVLELFDTIPWLLLYNAIFVLPMIAITLIVYAGIAKVEDVSDWKNRNIRYIHAIAGTIMLLLGLGMVLGLV